MVKPLFRIRVRLAGLPAVYGVCPYPTARATCNELANGEDDVLSRVKSSFPVPPLKLHVWHGGLRWRGC